MRSWLAPYLRVLLLITLLLTSATQSFAYTAGMAVDSTFGSGGFANIPPYDGTYTVSNALGFVRLPLSGGYIAFSKQNKSGTDHVVATRFNDGGAIDTNWGSGGQLNYAVPAPSGSDTFVVHAIEGGAERIYLVARYVSGGKGYLTVSTFGADGTFQNFSIDELISVFLGSGISEVEAVEAGVTLGGSQGILVAVKGGSGSTVALVGASAINNLPGTIHNVNYSLSRPTFRINWMRDRGDGKADILGTEGNQALYMRFAPSDFSHNTAGYVEAETYFDMPCAPGLGFTTSSVADGFVQPTAFAGAALVAGRVACSSGDAYSVLVRVAYIDTTPAVSWGTRLEFGFISGLGCLPPFSASGCQSAVINFSEAEPDEAFVGATGPGIAHLNITTAPAVLAGVDYNVNSPFVVPSYQLGSDYQYPYIVAFAGTGALEVGLARVAVDRVFADPFDQVP